MMNPKLIFISALALLCILGRSLGDSACPAGVSSVECLVDPCEAPPPSGCSGYVSCISDYCGGCKRHYYNSSGHEICTECPPSGCEPKQECPPVCAIFCPYGNVRDANGCPTCTCKPPPTPSQCPDVSCEIFCPHGNKLDANGCPLCECNPDPVCAPVLCASCPPGNQAVSVPGQCCPNCVSCANVTCPAPSCIPGYKTELLPGRCCPTCVPEPHCAVVLCPAVFSCPEGTVRVKVGCCDQCLPATLCASAVCPLIGCAPGFKQVFAPGACCPTCRAVPDCSVVDCYVPKCAEGFELVKEDLECCPTCKSIDRCASVKCAEPRCPQELWIQRDGQCCPQCPACIPSSDGRKTCDHNDDSVCTPGYFDGPDCGSAVPPTERREVLLEVEMCPCPNATASSKEEFVRRRIAALAQIDFKYVEVNSMGTSASCCRFQAKLSSTSSDRSIDPTQAQSTILANITSQKDMRVTAASSAMVVQAALLMVLATALVLLSLA